MKKLLTLSIASVVGLSGCATLQDQHLVDAAVKLPNTKNNDCVEPYKDCPTKDVFDLNTDFLPGFGSESESTYQLIQTAKDADARKARNALVTHLMAISDLRCEGHKSAIIANKATTDFLSGWVSTVSGIAGALVTGQDTTNILAGVSGASTATGDHINAAYYLNQLSGVIVKVIEDERNKKGTAIEQALSKDYSDYPIDNAILDVQRYHYACSFYQGIVQLAEKAGAKPSMTDVIDDEIMRVKSEISEVKTDENLKTDGQLVKQLEAELRILMARRATAGSPTTMQEIEESMTQADKQENGASDADADAGDNAANAGNNAPAADS